VSVIYTTWNARDLLRQSMNSLREQTAGIPYEVIVVDDASTDDTAGMVRAEFPDVTLLVNEKNSGFAKANNTGVASARGRYIFLLNNDTVLKQNVIKVCVDFLEGRDDAGVCGCRLKSPDGTSQVSFGNYPSFHQALADALFLNDLFPHAGFPKRGAFPEPWMTAPVEVDYVTGAAIMIRKSLIDQIGMFDEIYRSYSEETDFCYRVTHVAGRKVFFLPGAEVIHLGGWSYRNMRKYQIQLMFSSYDKFLRKYHGALYSFCTRVLYAWQNIVKMAVRFVRYLVAAGSARQEKKKYFLLAWYSVRYSLAPDERFTGQ
jgi:GT2 family glycosyltransferase